jgi:MYXO-CTERM domain-containing protein
MRATQTVVALVAASAVTFAGIRIADACGCVSPPIPDKAPDYAVNQRAEQIIFEVEKDYVTAHVLIKYAGEPSSFAWIVPVPEAPELGISPASAFGVLDQLTAPIVPAELQDICPISEWRCRYHPSPDCGGYGSDDDSPSFADAGSSSDAPGGGTPPPVDVIDEQVVGDYQTVTFRASEAALATQWLRDNGFIVNQTTALYMEPYVEANMVFVAAKLVPGAGVDAIKPLRLRYRAPFPMVPLVLTAVAAEPHLTVTTYIYGQTSFRPMSHPVVSIDAGRIAVDPSGRNNYPMVLARAVDDVGGDGFAVEYRNASPRPDYNTSAFCCETGGFDVCGVSDNDRCECPRDEFDRADCEARGDLLEGVALVDSLQARHAQLTRITTRISPEEMRFDPTFEPGVAGTVGPSGRLEARGSQPSLAGCVAQVIDDTSFAEINAAQGCAATYCGAGQCVVTSAGAGCACDAGFVARQFIDVDNQKSVTCIPAVPTVDLGAGGLELPDACQGVSCNMGACRDRNGVAVCACNGGAAAVRDPNRSTPSCEAIVELTGTPGAEDFSEPLRTLAVCAPRPPVCGSDGWLEQTVSPRVGVDCGDATPTAAERDPPPLPNCGGLTGGLGSMYGCGGCSGAQPAGGLALAWVVAFLLMRRRRAQA